MRGNREGGGSQGLPHGIIGVLGTAGRNALRLAAVTLAVSSVSLLAGTASASANGTCPSEWGFDRSVVPAQYNLFPVPEMLPGRALPGWFEGHTRCDVRLGGSFDGTTNNRASITDETTGATVATSGTGRGGCGFPEEGTRCSAYAPRPLGPWDPTAPLFIPKSGHSYRGDYHVELTAPQGLIWVDWDTRFCTVDSTQTVLTCDYYSRYSTISAMSARSVRTEVAPVLARGSG